MAIYNITVLDFHQSDYPDQYLATFDFAVRFAARLMIEGWESFYDAEEEKLILSAEYDLGQFFIIEIYED
jgi:hypothetical protein